jgi:hypothetical protein
VTGDLATGLDPEGVAVAPDGTLWLVDESKPWILHVSRTGAILERIAPPANVQRRANNQGFEGVAVSPDGRTVYAILQSPPANEVAAGNRLRTILLAYDIESRTFRQYRYQFDNPSLAGYPAGVSPRMGSSGLAVAGDDELFVIERDNLDPRTGNARIKRVYQVEVPAQATETPLAKTLVVDLMKLGYPYEKLEGVASPHPRHLVIVNDNDGDLGVPTELWHMVF